MHPSLRLEQGPAAAAHRQRMLNHLYYHTLGILSILCNLASTLHRRRWCAEPVLCCGAVLRCQFQTLNVIIQCLDGWGAGSWAEVARHRVCNTLRSRAAMGPGQGCRGEIVTTGLLGLVTPCWFPSGVLEHGSLKRLGGRATHDVRAGVEAKTSQDEPRRRPAKAPSRRHRHRHRLCWLPSTVALALDARNRSRHGSRRITHRPRHPASWRWPGRLATAQAQPVRGTALGDTGCGQESAPQVVGSVS